MRNKDKFDKKQRSVIKHWKKKLLKIDANLYRKLEVLDYAAKGYTNKEISHLTDYSQSRVSDLVSEFAQNGIGYFLHEHRKGGNRRNLTNDQEKLIIDKFKEKAEKGQVVKLNDMKEEYERLRGA